MIIDDFTPIVIGPYEDPNIAEAFVNDPSVSDATSSDRNAMLMSSTRNLAKIKLHVRRVVCGTSVVCMRV